MALNILLVEDNRSDALLASTFLSLHGAVTHASSLKEAVSCIGQEKFDLIVTDLDLGDSQPGQTIDALANYTQQTPIVAYTSTHSDEIDLSRVHGVINKMDIMSVYRFSKIVEGAMKNKISIESESILFEINIKLEELVQWSRALGAA